MNHKYATVPFLNAEPAWLSGFDVVTPWYAQGNSKMPKLWLIEQRNMNQKQLIELTLRGGQVHENFNSITQFLQEYERKG